MKKIFIFLILMTVVVAPLIAEEFFGQNKIQYKDFDWKILSTAHFKIYYYDGMDSLSLYAANIVENAYDSLIIYFNIQPENKIPIILYRSHADFEQTNVTPEILEEWVGGFTEILRDRMVIPFTGDYEEFRHVLVHELNHAFQFALMKKGSMDNFIEQYMYTIPLWYVEGMSEYYSLGMDPECDMFLYDAFINDTFPSFEDIDYSGYGVYKYGQGIIYYIAQTYGDKAVPKVLTYTKSTKSFKKGIEKALGVNLSMLEKEFRHFMIKRYAKVADKHSPNPAIGWSLKLEHKQDFTFAEGASISPDGNYIVYITNSSGYIDLYITSLFPDDRAKKILSFGKTGIFESMHYTRPYFGWDKNSEKIVFSAKREGQDYIYIYNVKKGKMEKHIKMANLDGIFYTVFGDSVSLYFSGISKGYTDIYYYNMETKEVLKITNDVYVDWMPIFIDGTMYFVSDRPDEGKDWIAGDYAIFKYESSDSIIRVSPRMKGIESVSVYKNKFYFSATQNGEYVLFRMDTLGNLERISDIYSSVKSPTVSANGRIAYLLYHERSWDIWVADDVDDIPAYNFNTQLQTISKSLISPIFYNGDYKQEKRSVAFGIDWIGGMLLYNSITGPMGYLVGYVSDDLGDNKIAFAFSGQDQDNLDVEVGYWYLPKRIDIGLFGIYQRYMYYIGSDGYYYYYGKYGITGLGTMISYPIDRFNRFDIYGDFSVYSYQEMAIDPYYNSYWSLPLSAEVSNFYIEYIKDNALWGYYAPFAGTLMRIGIYTTLVNEDHFITDYDATEVYSRYLRTDLRYYIRTSKRSNLAFRALSYDNLINNGQELEIYDEYLHFPYFYSGDIEYFLGKVFNEELYYLKGNHIRVLQAEYRFPFIDKIEPSCGGNLGMIRGSVFVDFIDANTDMYSSFLSYDNALVHSLIEYGLGFRIFTMGILIKTDFIWATDIKYNDFLGISITFGPEF